MPELKEAQKRAVNFNQGNILVSASAGSGKTFVMIQRAIRLITEKKADVKEILAVTYTESAAEEMKQKLKDALIEKIRQTGEKELVKQLDDIGLADISTMHAFCAKIIRRYFFVAGVSPDFKIIDDGQANKLKTESINQTFKKLYDKCYIEKNEQNPSDLERVSDWFFDLINLYSEDRSDRGLKKQIQKIFEFVETEAYPEEMLKKYEYVYSDEGFERLKVEYKAILDKHLSVAIDRLSDFLYEFNSQDFPKSNKYLQGLIGDYEEIKSASLYGAKEFFKNSRTLSFDKNLSSEYAEKKETVKKIRDFISEIIKRYDSILTTEEDDKKQTLALYLHTERLCNITREFIKIYDEKKREENYLDFSDLEHFGLKVLSDETARQEIRERYKYIFIDEYQDVNGVQEELLNKISNNNLFMVGDLKQSIYGFRGCRADFFKNKYDNMKKNNEETVLLNHNFRSANAVINMVNEIFAYSYKEDYSGLSYEKTSMLISGGTYGDEHPGRAELHLLKKPKPKEKAPEKPRIYDVLDAQVESNEELSATTLLLTDIINQELQKTYYDPNTKEYKPVKYGDIAILSRVTSSPYVVSIVRELIKHGIPVASLVKENVTFYPEVIMLIEALKLVDNFYQDVALATTLKSPIGGFTDEDFADVAIFYRDNKKLEKKPDNEPSVRENKTFSKAVEYYVANANTPLKDRLVEFKEYFDKVRYIADYVGAFGVLNKLIEDRGVYAYLLAQSDGERKRNRLETFVSASLRNGKTLTVSEFLDLIELSPSAFELLEYAKEDAVKVMTIHSSKGLEYPVTIVIGVEKSADSRDDRLDILRDREFGFAVKLYDKEEKTVKETLLRGVIQEKNAINRMNEELRLFYVATTRAKYSLHLVAYTNTDKRFKEFVWGNKYLDYIPSTVQGNIREPEEFEFISLKAEPRKILIGKDDQIRRQEMIDNFAWEYDFSEDTKLPLKSSVTASLAKNEEQPPVKVVFTESDTSAEKGTIAHKILELYDFESGESIEDFAKKLVDDKILTAEQVQRIDLNRIQKGTNSFIEKVRGKKTYPEQPFIINIPANMLFDSNSKEEILVQGVIDLLVLDANGGAEIIDYKYSSLSKEKLLEKYQKQLSLYAYAVESVLGLKVNSKTLVNIYSGETVEVL